MDRQLRHSAIAHQLIACLIAWLLVPGAGAQLYEIWHGSYAESPSLKPPRQADWHPVDLPHFWNIDKNAAQPRTLWYRFDLPDINTELEQPAVFVSRLILNADIYLGDYYLGNGGQMSPPVARNWNRPFLFPIPAEIFAQARARGDSLYVRLTSEPPFGLMPLVEVGELAELQPIWWRNQLIRIELSRAVSVILILISAFGLLLWRRLDAANAGFLALASLFWLIPLSFAYMQYVPLTHLSMLRLSHCAIDAAGVSLLLFALSYFNRLRRLHLKLAGGYMAAILIVNLSVPAERLVLVANIIHLGIQTGFLVTLLACLRSWFRQPETGMGVLSAGILVILAASVHDVSLSLSHDVNRWRWDVHVGHLAMPVLFILLSWHLTQNFNRQLAQASALNQELTRRVEDEKLKLIAQYQDRESLELDNRLQQERERVYRDLHDDLGARLLSLIYRADDERNRDLGRAALQDLRDVVSRSCEHPMRLEAMLQDSLNEQQERAQKLGRQLDWQIQGPSLEIDYPATVVLLLRRVIRETLTLLLHRTAQPTHILCLHSGHTGLEISVEITGMGSAALTRLSAALSRHVKHMSGHISFTEANTTMLAIWIPHPIASSPEP